MTIADQEGNIAVSYTYDACGNIMSKAGDLANKNPYRYKGRHGYYYDADTDLYLLNSRWYNPELKRFMIRDNQQGEATDPVSLNRYVYCGNDPVNYVDPIGTYRVTVSINGGGSPKPTVPEPPKPPQKPTLSSPTQIAPTSGKKQSSSSTVISQTVKTSQPTESAPQAPAQPTVIQNLIKGTYFGTQYGEENTDWYVQRIVEMEHDAAWYELAPYYVGAGFSVLWTPDTWWMTAGTLIGGLAVAKFAAGATLAKVAGGIKSASAIISGWLGCGGTVTASGQLHHVLSNKIMAALNSHPVLRGVFNRCDYLVRALTANAHKGYQIWHRLYDAKVVQWLLDNPNATPAKFIDFLNQIYRDPEMIERFGRFIIKIMR